MVFIPCFLKNTKKSQSHKSQSHNRGFRTEKVYFQNSTLFICKIRAKNTPQKWLFLAR